MSIISLYFYSALWLGIFSVPCLGQASKQFQWQFQNQALSTMLPTCVSFPIVVKSFDPTTNATHGTPPFFMMSFPVGGTPVVQSIGDDPDNLSWTVTQPAGSILLLSVVDANGGAGGSPPQLLTVIPGQTTECVTTPPPSTPAFTVSANVSGSLQTCQPWGITVKGGSPPYSLTLVETNSPVVTNVSMPFGADRFTFPNRADPGGQLIAAISDVEGRWATGTPLVQPVGSTDTTCTGLVSSSGNATLIDEQDNALNASINAAKQRKSLLIGLVVTLILVLFLGFGGIFCLQRKKRREDQAEERRPTQFVQLPETSEMVPVPGVTVNKAGAVEYRLNQKRGVGTNNTRNSDIEAPPYTETDSSAGPSSTIATLSSSVFPPLPRVPDTFQNRMFKPKPPKLEMTSLPSSTTTTRRVDLKSDTRRPLGGPTSSESVRGNTSSPSLTPASTKPSSSSASSTTSAANFSPLSTSNDGPKRSGSGFNNFPSKSIRMKPLNTQTDEVRGSTSSARSATPARSNVKAPSTSAVAKDNSNTRGAPPMKAGRIASGNPFINAEEEGDDLDMITKYYRNEEEEGGGQLPPRYRRNLRKTNIQK